MIQLGAEFNIFKGTTGNIGIISSNYWYKEANLNVDRQLEALVELIPHQAMFKSHTQFIEAGKVYKFQFNVTYNTSNMSITLIKTSESKYSDEDSIEILRNILSH